MMNLEQVAITDFVLLQADWEVRKGRDLIQALRPTHVIVHRQEQDQNHDYYLVTAPEMLRLLAQPLNGSRIAEILDQYQVQTTVVREASSDVESAPDRCII